MALLDTLSGNKNKSREHEIKGITDNINHILNTTQGYGFFLPNFGLSDCKCYGNREDMAKAIINEMTEAIQLYEPRVALGQIVGIEDNRLLRLSFRIDCVVRSTGHSLALYLDAVHDHYQLRP